MSRENQNRFAKDLNKCGIIEGELVLATCSGGPDSMLLLHALKSIGSSFEVAHINFKLRGDESDGDEAFVRQWCLKNNVAFHCETMDASALAEETGKGIQDAARVLRYEYFEEVKNQIGDENNFRLIDSDVLIEEQQGKTFHHPFFRLDISRSQNVLFLLFCLGP